MEPILPAFAKALIAAQKSTEAVYKGSSNPAFKSKYADLAAVVEATIPAMNENGISVMQHPDFDGDMLVLTTILMHESGASMSHVMRMPISKRDPQGIGSATTYARRYSLLAITGTAPEDDDGNAASGQAKALAPKPVKTISQDVVDNLEALLEMTGTDKAKFLAFYKIPKLSEISEADLDHAVTVLNKKVP
jgi:hypothetical protein